MRRLALVCGLFLAAAPALAEEVWREPITGMEFVRVQGGCFHMGDVFGDGAFNEKPVHEVCIDDFLIGRTEVTQGQWQAVMGDNPSFFARGPDYPVEGMTLQEIEQFIQRLNAAGNGHFRLPTEAEWEYACRAGGRKAKYGTRNGEIGGGLANYQAAEGAPDPYPETAPVASFPPNPLGLYDMSGNVWEWVADIYAADAYKHHRRDNPLYQGNGPSRLLRGGGWSFEAPFLRCAKRRMHCRPSVRYDFIGLRLVREAG